LDHADRRRTAGACLYCERVGNYFDVLGIKPMLGRFFLAEEEARPVLFPTWSWAIRFGRRVMPKTRQLWQVDRDRPASCDGDRVAPEGCRSNARIREDLWVTLDPLGTDVWRMTHRDADWLNVIGRLRLA